MSAAPPDVPPQVLADLRKRQALALQMQAFVSQLLLEHHHAEVLDTLLGGYVALATTCPNCTEQAIRVLPALGAQLKAIASLRPATADTTPGTPPGGKHLH